MQEANNLFPEDKTETMRLRTARRILEFMEMHGTGLKSGAMQSPKGKMLMTFLTTELGKPQKSVPVRQRCASNVPFPNLAMVLRRGQEGR